MQLRLLGSWLGALALATLFACSSAAAAGPATVTVRVEGLSSTVLPQTTVTTTSAARYPDGTDACSGTSAGGALWDATGGQWSGPYDSSLSEYEVDSILGVNLATSSDLYWAFWVDDAPAQVGACEQELNAGDDVVFFEQCYATGSDCASGTAPDHFLTETAPTDLDVNVGTPVSVTVGSVNTTSGSAESLPGDVVVTAGGLRATPNANGVATLTFTTPGAYTLQASGPDSVPSDPHTVCVHSGNDGTCGTTAAALASPAGPAAPSAPTPYRGPYAVVSIVGGIIDDHTYARHDGPRVLRGTVYAHVPLASVSISLQRLYRRRCSQFDGASKRFVSARCGARRPFAVGTSSTFSYLLPVRLAPGTYSYTVSATDNAGNRTAVIGGGSRVQFYVR
ncbi:MAG TPA: DUF4430 domain-containing protein [Solirubrobacteraceae bacterium]|jgi:hypothetical protein|nr:DUF4430 domain-containing protein [Solirubrobacteraceae bacterium]